MGSREVGGGGHKGRERQRRRDSVFVGFCTPNLKSSRHNRVRGTCRVMYFLWFTRLLLSLFPISAYLHPLLAVPISAVCGCRPSNLPETPQFTHPGVTSASWKASLGETCTVVRNTQANLSLYFDKQPN